MSKGGKGGAGGKDAKGKAKVNLALEYHADIDINRLIAALTKTAVNMAPVSAFVKKIKQEAQDIKDAVQIETPTIPLFVTEPMDFECCRALFDGLLVYPWLRYISLYHCHIGDDGVMVVADFIKRYRPHAERNPFGIEVLELPECDIGPRGASYLGRILTQNETVKVLNLDFNPLGNEGAVNLGDGLKWNSTVEKLSLKYCSIGPEGGEAVGKFIIRSSSVQELSLRGNQLGPYGIIQISRSLAKNPYLRKLDLADTGFGIDLEAIEALRDGLESNDSLETVDLNLNSMVPTGTQLLLEMLKGKPKLTQFDIFERVSDTVFRDILDTVQNNIKLMKKKKKKGKGGGKKGKKGG